MPQAPAAHIAVALASEQGRLHAPQFAGDVAMFTSQPLAASPSQSAKPSLQVMPQRPAVHDAVPLVPLHALPHAPQCATVFCRFTSQPFAALRSQSPNPALHELIAHMPATQEGVAFAGRHALPQRPQCVVDEARSAHMPGGHNVSVPQSLSHTPERQTIPSAQRVPQAPQCCGEVPSSASQPLASIASQLPRPSVHAATTQRPALHAAVAPMREHAVPHAPQCMADVVRSVSQPLLASPSQSPRPVGHAPAQRPSVHNMPMGQVRPHAPQLRGSAAMRTSQPVRALRSQSAVTPEMHVNTHTRSRQVEKGLTTWQS
jgi:hypothetical protein